MKITVIISFVLVVLCATNLHTQTFTFVVTDPLPVYGPADTVISCHASVNNLTNSPITLNIVIGNVSVPSGWEQVGMCTWEFCYAPGFYNVNEICPPGPHVFYVYFYPNNIPGNGSCLVTISHQSTSISRNFEVVANPIGIIQLSNVVDGFKLSQNYPNPFNPVTKIEFAIPTSDYVDLRVYDILGREVKVLLSQQLSTGEYEVEFDAKNFASGMYYYRLQSGDNISVKKMTLVK